MRKRLFLLATLVLLVLTVSVHAIEPFSVQVKPSLGFSGTTAECSAVCTGRNRTDEIQATLTLYCDGDEVDSWSETGTFRVAVSGECGVERGEEYTLELVWYINGVKQQSASTTGVCPLYG